MIPQPPVIEFTDEDLDALFDLKYRASGKLGPDPTRRRRYNDFDPDNCYKTLVRRLVTNETRWLDVDCGRDLFPSNRALAAELSQRCEELVGVDPDETLEENPFVHCKIRGMVEDIPPEMRFSLVTLRMVAEHVADPTQMLRTLSGIVAPGGIVVVYTIKRWSPVPLITTITPFALHNPIKHIFWRTDAKDTFPTTYKMNTRHDLQYLFANNGFQETGFDYLDDCRTMQRFHALNILELSTRTLLHRFGIRYPEDCLLGTHRRRDDQSPRPDEKVVGIQAS